MMNPRRASDPYRVYVPNSPVGLGPHGVCVFPQPGRYSLGHTGNFR